MARILTLWGGKGKVGPAAGLAGDPPAQAGFGAERLRFSAPLGLHRGLAPVRAALLALMAARGQLLPLVAGALGCGIGLWFSWGAEPELPAYLAFAAGALAALCFAWRGPELGRVPALFAFALLVGFLAAGARAHLQAAPVLGFRYYGPVQGRVVLLDRSGSDALRITLDQVVLERMDPGKTPEQVRISLHGDMAPAQEPRPGQTVILTAHLAPPQGPVEPGGFDFRRMAFFERLGAVGYTATPVLVLAPAAPAEALIGRMRSHLSEGIRAQIPGQAGAFAAGAMTGDRSGISPHTVDILSDSSLAHILAISGMNMAFLAGFVFALLRGGIAFLPWLALRVNARKLAAALSLPVAAFYLALSGSNVATEWAFVMICVMLGAVLLDRRAMSLRAAALAAILLLLWQPEALLSPGFQMSMAATVALICGVRALDRMVFLHRWPRWLVPAFTLCASSVVGGMATAPYAAAHFNRFADYGLLANILTVPAMGILIMPMGVLAFLLAPVGLAWIPLWFMGLGARWTLAVAEYVAAFEGSVTAIPAPPAGVLALVSLGGLWLLAWPGRARIFGAGALGVALFLWPLGQRPVLLISEDGKLAGLMGSQGRALSRPKGGGFAAENWLESDGDLVHQPEAAARPGFSGPKAQRELQLNGLTMVLLSGKAGLKALPTACARADLVILSEPAPAPLPKGLEACPLIDTQMLRKTGSLAFSQTASGLTLTMTGANARIWSGPMPDRTALSRLLPAGIQLQ